MEVSYIYLDQKFVSPLSSITIYETCSCSCCFIFQATIVIGIFSCTVSVPSVDRLANVNNCYCKIIGYFNG